MTIYASLKLYHIIRRKLEFILDFKHVSRSIMYTYICLQIYMPWGVRKRCCMRPFSKGRGTITATKKWRESSIGMIPSIYQYFHRISRLLCQLCSNKTGKSSKFLQHAHTPAISKINVVLRAAGRGEFQGNSPLAENIALVRTRTVQYLHRCYNI